MIKRLVRWLRGPELTIKAKVIRADGTVEDLGVVARGRQRRWKTGVE